MNNKHYLIGGIVLVAIILIVFMSGSKKSVVGLWKSSVSFMGQNRYIEISDNMVTLGDYTTISKFKIEQKGNEYFIKKADDDSVIFSTNLDANDQLKINVPGIGDGGVAWIRMDETYEREIPIKNTYGLWREPIDGVEIEILPDKFKIGKGKMEETQASYQKHINGYYQVVPQNKPMRSDLYIKPLNSGKNLFVRFINRSSGEIDKQVEFFKPVNR